MNVWYLIFLCGFLTFLIRFIPMSGVINFQGSTLYAKVIKEKLPMKIETS